MLDAGREALAGDLASQIQINTLSIIVNLPTSKKIKSLSSLIRFPACCNKKQLYVKLIFFVCFALSYSNQHDSSFQYSSINVKLARAYNIS